MNLNAPILLVIVAIGGFSTGAYLDGEISPHSFRVPIQIMSLADTQSLPFFQTAEMSSKVQTIIDKAYVDFNIAQITDGDFFRNVVDQCIFHSEESFKPLCIKCEFLNNWGNVIAKGEKIDLHASYVANQEIPIEMFSTPAPPPGEPLYPDVQDVHKVQISICGVDNGEGCTPGFWKQKQHFGSWPKEYKTTTKFGDVFSTPANLKIKVDNSLITLKTATLLQALNAQGGDVNALARHGVAALLNAASHINYPYTVQQVKDMVNAALADSSKIEDTKNKLAIANEKGCPFGRDECETEDHKQDHKKHYDDFKKDYDDHKKSYSKEDYKKHLDSFKKYFDDNKHDFDKEDFKTYMDYYKKYLDDNQKNFGKDDYRKYSDDYKKYNNEYPKHGDKCKCDNDKDHYYLKDDHDSKSDNKKDKDNAKEDYRFSSFGNFIEGFTKYFKFYRD